MLATYGAAALIVVASLLIGRAFLELLGRRQTWWLESSIGLAILLVTCSLTTRIHFGAEDAGTIPERAELSLIACAVLLVASIAYLRFRFLDRRTLAIAAPVVALTVLIASLPFISVGALGIPGIGVNNDMAAHLIWADWLQNPTGPSPNGIRIGYPLGPHGLVAMLSDLLGSEPFYMFLGLLIAIPVITALTALNLLRSLPPVKRTGAAALVAMPYLAASTFGIAGFKEMLAGLFLISFALILRTLPRTTEGRIGLIGGLAALGAGTVACYSYAGLAWLAGTFGLWALAELVVAWRQGRSAEVRAELRRAAPLLGLGLAALGLLILSELPRIKDFIDSGAADTITSTDSKLRFPVPAPEALGVWPSGEWLFGYGERGLDSWQLFAAIGLVAFVFAGVWWSRRGEVALLAAVGASAVVYIGTLSQAGLYVEAKALQVPAALLMLFILGALLLRPGSAERPAGTGPDGSEPDGPDDGLRERRATERSGIGLRAVIAVPFIALAAYSSFLALRDAVIAPDDRFRELQQFSEQIEGKGVLDLTSDRYAAYYLRSGEVRSPAKNAEDKFVGRPGKDFRLPVDFDSVFASDQDTYDFAVTTDAEYQSGAPPNWEEADRTESYVLWRRAGPTPFVGVLAEEARPGRVFRCSNPKLARLRDRRGVAITWPRPVIAKRLNWDKGEGASEQTTRLEPGESASQTITLPAGRWDLSFQYTSEIASLEVTAGDLSAEMPPGVEGAIPFRPDEGPYWPVGELTSDGEPLEISVRANTLSRLQRLLGVDAPAAIGNVAATRLEDRSARTLAASCGAYIDHYYLGAPGALGGQRKQGGTLNLDPTR